MTDAEATFNTKNIKLNATVENCWIKPMEVKPCSTMDPEADKRTSSQVNESEQGLCTRDNEGKLW